MDIELLRTFIELSRIRHFGQTAEAMFLTQAAVSARIKSLEQIMGVTLFDRQKREIQLTSEGHRLLKHANHMIAEWRKARQEVTAGGAQAQLSVGGGVRILDIMLEDWLIHLRSARPDIAVIVEVHNPEILTRKLLDGVLDLGFLIEPPQLDVLHTKKAAELTLNLYSTRTDQTAVMAVEDGYLMVDWGLSHALYHRRLFPDASEPHVRLANARMAVYHMQIIGGSAYLPESLILDQLESGLFHLVEDAPVITHTIYAIYPVRSTRLKLIREVLQLFQIEYD
jgi:DNA-binding transcriptional LysR family regulator